MMVLKIDWSQWSKTSGRIASSPRYALLTTPDALKQSQHDGGEWLREAVLEAPPAERQALMENYLREQIAKVLRTSPAKIETNRPLNELGLDSLMAVELLHRIESQLSVAMPTGQLMGGPTIVKLAALLVDNLTGGNPGAGAQKENRSAKPEPAPKMASPDDLDFTAETTLDATIRFAGGPADARQTTNPAVIFLTGAAEFLGAYLLTELLERTRADVYCLVNAPDVAEAGRRIQDNLARYALGTDRREARIIPVLGAVWSGRGCLRPVGPEGGCGLPRQR
jgi:acyl carrier protein